ncbi:hypothetical protein [Photobacterium galatheae]|uniref:Uncharacterized protein n=1 Tax=Photobacterium galatheae TaxID=1654360 RepID=A0A066RPW7_9GAMM|nr:hypothetical protein [Photobacterium galatheae]KDM89687.1 hypothetical protein EA58_21000 [Photobacterium galatheae]MCM0151561.1 hypothetical protein [Photobacterium galatheae]
MALNKDSLKQKIITNLKAKGFVTEGEHAAAGDMAEAIAAAVVEEITQNAKVNVSSGISKGLYSIT